MGVLVHFDCDASWGETRVCDELITRDLAHAGLTWGRWEVDAAVADASLQELMAAPPRDLALLRARFGVCWIDRIRSWPALQHESMAEYLSAEAEVRCFVEGSGLLYIRVADGFLGLLCEAGEWVALPAGTRHRFDTGDAPGFDALRLFSGRKGTPARPTGAASLALPPLDDFVNEMLRLTGLSADLED